MDEKRGSNTMLSRCTHYSLVRLRLRYSSPQLQSFVSIRPQSRTQTPLATPCSIHDQREIAERISLSSSTYSAVRGSIISIITKNITCHRNISRIYRGAMKSNRAAFRINLILYFFIVLANDVAYDEHFILLDI